LDAESVPEVSYILVLHRRRLSLVFNIGLVGYFLLLVCF